MGVTKEQPCLSWASSPPHGGVSRCRNRPWDTTWGPGPRPGAWGEPEGSPRGRRAAPFPWGSPCGPPSGRSAGWGEARRGEGGLLGDRRRIWGEKREDFWGKKGGFRGCSLPAPAAAAPTCSARGRLHLRPALRRRLRTLRSETPPPRRRGAIRSRSPTLVAGGGRRWRERAMRREAAGARGRMRDVCGGAARWPPRGGRGGGSAGACAGWLPWSPCALHKKCSLAPYVSGRKLLGLPVIIGKNREIWCPTRNFGRIRLRCLVKLVGLVGGSWAPLHHNYLRFMFPFYRSSA